MSAWAGNAFEALEQLARSDLTGGEREAAVRRVREGLELARSALRASVAIDEHARETPRVDLVAYCREGGRLKREATEWRDAALALLEPPRTASVALKPAHRSAARERIEVRRRRLSS